MTFNMHARFELNGRHRSDANVFTQTRIHIYTNTQKNENCIHNLEDLKTYEYAKCQIRMFSFNTFLT